MPRQRTQQAAATQPQRVDSMAGVSFPQGVMHVHGVPQTIVRAIERMSSNGLTRYTAIEWQDARTDELRVSCNCAGWCNRRSCKHVKELIEDPSIGLLGEETALPRQITAQPRTVTRTIGERSFRGLTFEVDES